MAVIRDRPETTRRLNAVDAAVVLVLAIMIPLAYLAYLLFRPPQPRLVGVTPTSIVQGISGRLLIHGQNLRPFMRISLNDIQAKNFAITSVTGAEADLPTTLAPGTYDVVLYDYAQEVSRLPRAVTVVPAAPTPSLTMLVGGAFVGLQRADAERVKPGLKLAQGDTPDNGVAEVVSVGAPTTAAVRIRVGDSVVATPVADRLLVPAVVRVSCYTEALADGTLRCIVPSAPQPVPLVPDAFLSFRTPEQWYSFQISDVRGEARPPAATVRGRFVIAREIARRMKAGDVDTTVTGYEPDIAPRIVSLDQPPPPSGASSINDAPVTVVVTFRLPVQQLAHGWAYRGRPLKTGITMTFETDEYTISGMVIDYNIGAAAR